MISSLIRSALERSVIVKNGQHSASSSETISALRASSARTPPRWPSAGAQRIGFTLDEIRELLGPGRRPAHERLRTLTIDKLPEIEEIISARRRSVSS